jgi:outer membrane protein OmpA-like peptidoglycan-associated protein
MRFTMTGVNRSARGAAVLLLAVVLVAEVGGCSAARKNTRTGAAIGGAAGTVVGGIVGHKLGNTATGAIIGAAVGGATGAVIGDYMDRQAAELERDLQTAKIERIGEGIKITFESGLLFAVDDASLSTTARADLADLAGVLQKYDDTNILIEGHTDSTGPEQYNEELSRRRADAVASYLAMQGVMRPRMSVMGYGESQPVADNATEAGRSANRRVEVAIMANDELKAAAERQAAAG